MTYATEFPGFPADAMPSLPAGFRDRSWRHEACPCFIHDESGLILWIGHPDPALREWDGPRFIAEQCRTFCEANGWQFDEAVVLRFETDDWATVLRSLPNFTSPLARWNDNPVAYAQAEAHRREFPSTEA